MTVAIEDVKILGDTVLVYDMEFGAKKSLGGIIIRDDDMTVAGAHPRWSRVLAVGPEFTDVKVGQYILQPHGEWTRGFSMLKDGKKVTVRMIRNTEILLVADEPTQEYQLAEKL